MVPIMYVSSKTRFKLQKYKVLGIFIALLGDFFLKIFLFK